MGNNALQNIFRRKIKRKNIIFCNMLIKKNNNKPINKIQ